MNGTIQAQDKMCDACYGYIHDTLLSPLPKESPFHKHIHAKSLERAVHKLVPPILRAITSFKHGDIFFMLPCRLEHRDPFIQTQVHNEFIWKQFISFYPSHATDLTSLIDILLDNSVIRKTAAHHQLAEVYIRSQFHAILLAIKQIHHEHTERIAPPNPPSPGRVPAWKIAHLKAKSQGGTWMDHFKISVAAVPPPPPLTNEKLTIRVPVSIDDDPLYW